MANVLLSSARLPCAFGTACRLPSGHLVPVGQMASRIPGIAMAVTRYGNKGHSSDAFLLRDELPWIMRAVGMVLAASTFVVYEVSRYCPAAPAMLHDQLLKVPRLPMATFATHPLRTFAALVLLGMILYKLLSFANEVRGAIALTAAALPSSQGQYVEQWRMDETEHRPATGMDIEVAYLEKMLGL